VKTKNANPSTPFQPILSFIDLCVLVGSSLSTTGMHLNDVVCYSLHFLEIRLVYMLTVHMQCEESQLIHTLSCSYILTSLTIKIRSNRERIVVCRSMLSCAVWWTGNNHLLNDYPDQSIICASLKYGNRTHDSNFTYIDLP
jgi:hypothetical protein